MHKRVTTARIFYRGQEHSAIYYGGEEKFEVGRLRDKREPIRVYMDPAVEYYGVNTKSDTYQELRDMYSNADYPVNFYISLYAKRARGAYRWRVDWDYFEFSYKGACTIGIRGDGVVKFDDGSRQLVKTKVIQNTDGTYYVSTEMTRVKCPATATKGIFVGTLSPLGMVRYGSFEKKGLSKEAMLAFNNTLAMLDFSYSGVYDVKVGYEAAQGAVGNRCPSRMTFAFVEFMYYAAARIATQYNGKTYYMKAARHSVNYREKRYNNYSEVAAMLNLRRAFMYTPIEEVPITLLRKLGNLRDADAAAEEHWNNTGAPGNYSGYNYYFTDHCTGTMEGMFLGCSNITTLPADVFKALKPCDCAYAFSNCKGLTELPEGLFDWFYQQTLNRNMYRYEEVEGVGLCFNNPHAQLRGAFKGCSNLRGSTPTITMEDGSKKKIWEVIGTGEYPGNSLAKLESVTRWKKNTDTITYLPQRCKWCNGCFEGCTGLDDYDEIPDTWKLPIGKAIFNNPVVSDYTGETITVFDIEDSGDPYTPYGWN